MVDAVLQPAARACVEVEASIWVAPLPVWGLANGQVRPHCMWRYVQTAGVGLLCMERMAVLSGERPQGKLPGHSRRYEAVCGLLSLVAALIQHHSLYPNEVWATRTWISKPIQYFVGRWSVVADLSAVQQSDRQCHRYGDSGRKQAAYDRCDLGKPYRGGLRNYL